MSLELNGTTGVQGNSGAFVAGTAVASTSGTSIDFTSIPSWVKRITVMFQGVSLNGGADILIQLGVSSSAVTSGYLGTSASIASSTAGASNYTAGIGLRSGGGSGAAGVRHGAVIINNISGNAWVSQGSVGYSDAATCVYTGSSISLAGVLNMIRITTSTGTDTFDAGSINILYE